MRFEITHTFDHPVEVVEAALLDPAVTEEVGRRMQKIREVVPLEVSDQDGTVRRRMRYLPEPLIRKIGPKTVEARWMEWTEESAYQRHSRTMRFSNVPRLARVAKLVENRGTLFLEDVGGRTRRTVRGELTVKVRLLGRVAERIIHKQAVGILDEEAQVLAALLAERAS